MAGQLVFYGAFRERNLWIFVEKKLSIPNLVFLFLKSLFEWVTLYYHLSLFSYGVFRLIVLVSLIL